MSWKQSARHSANHEVVLPQVFVFYTLLQSQPWADWQPALPPAYSERLGRMRNTDARARTLGGLWLLQHGMTLAGFGPAPLTALERDQHDRPRFTDGPEFNISHSGDLIACVITRELAVGLDVERVRQVDAEKLSRFLAPHERHEAASDSVSFFRAWTAREAVVKATGRAGLARIARVQIAADHASVDGEQLYLHRLALVAGYEACLATADAVIRIQHHKLT